MHVPESEACPGETCAAQIQLFERHALVAYFAPHFLCTIFCRAKVAVFAFCQFLKEKFVQIAYLAKERILSVKSAPV